MEAKLDMPKVIDNKIDKSVVDGVVICCDCGSTKTTLSKKGVYCNECKRFRLFKKGKFELIKPIESYKQLDDDD